MREEKSSETNRNLIVHKQEEQRDSLYSYLLPIVFSNQSRLVTILASLFIDTLSTTTSIVAHSIVEIRSNPIQLIALLA